MRERRRCRPGWPKRIVCVQKRIIFVCCVLSLSLPGTVQAAQVATSAAQKILLTNTFCELPPSPDASQPRPEDLQAEARQQLMVGIVFRNRKHQLLYDRAIQLFTDNKPVDALIQLQKLLDLDEDCFVRSTGKRELQGARQSALELIRNHNSEVWQVYERLYGRDAADLWRQTQLNLDEKRIAEICRKYSLTEAGFAAANWRASHCLDQGEFLTAASFFNQLIHDPVHRHRVTPIVLFKTAYAEKMCQRPTSRQLLEKVFSNPATLGDSKSSAAEYLTEPIDGKGNRVVNVEYSTRNEEGYIRVASTDSSQLSSGGTIPGGRVAYSATRSATDCDVPYLSPLWVREYAEEPQKLLDRAFQHWQKQRFANSQPIAIVNRPAVSKGVVFYRDDASIRALRVSDGQPVWHYPCHVSLKKAVASIIEQYGYSPNTDARLHELVNLYAGNSITGSMTCDAEHLYAIEDMQILPTEGTIRAVSPGADNANSWNNRVSRRSNRLIALPVDATGGVWVPAWSVGGGIGPPDWFRVMDHDGDQQVSNSEFRGSNDQFRKIDINSDGWISARESEAVAGNSENHTSELAGHFFLGAPLVVGTRLYVMAEKERQLKLVVLDAATGSVIRSQRIGYVDTSIDSDMARYSLACTPRFSRGVVVCPTQKNVLVGIDEAGGNLLWTYYYGDLVKTEHDTGWAAVNRLHGHRGFDAPLHVSGDQVFYLPRQSNRLHCIDLLSGQGIWAVDRQRAEYVGHIDENVIVVVGRQHCRGLVRETGEQLWELRCGTPVGRGVCQNGTFLLPVEEGRVIAIDVFTGSKVGFCASKEVRDKWLSVFSHSKAQNDKVHSSWNLGNLVVDGDRVLSLSAREIVAFVPARIRLKELYEQIAWNEPTRDEHLLIGELELLLGEFTASQQHLMKCKEAFAFDEKALFAEHLMRELFYLQLEQSPAECESILAKLDKASHSSTERGRYLMHRTKVQNENKNYGDVIAAAHQLAAVDLAEPLNNITDATHWVSVASWGPKILQPRNEEIKELLDNAVQQQQKAVLESSSIDQLKGFLALYADRPEAAPVRWRLAQLYESRGNRQKAELLLLRNRESRDENMVAAATVALVELWSQAGLYQEAAGLLREMEQEFSTVRLPNGQTGLEYVEAFDHGHLTWLAYKNQMPLDKAVSRVSVSEVCWWDHDPQVKKSFSGYGRRFMTSHNSPFVLLDKGNATQSQITLIDRQTGWSVGEMNVPALSTYPSRVSCRRTGHLLPLGSSSTMHGLSLLERWRSKPIWSVTPPHSNRKPHEMMRVGPVGVSFCVYQSRSRLVVVDPVEGRVLWQRTELPAGSGLLNGTSYGLLGDENALVLFHADGSKYTVFDTQTGEVLAKRVQNEAPFQRQYAFGRKLLFLRASESADNEQVLKLWDPVSDRVLFQSTVRQRLLSVVSGDDQIAFVTPDRMLYVVDIPTTRTVVAKQLNQSDVEYAHRLSVFADQSHYYVNLQHYRSRDRNAGQPHISSNFVNDSFIPTASVLGDLHVFDKSQGEYLWKRTFSQRSVFQHPYADLPFLITASHVKHRTHGSNRSILLELIDKTNGETMVRKDNIGVDRFLQFSYDRASQKIDLRCKNRVVKVAFDTTSSNLAER